MIFEFQVFLMFYISKYQFPGVKLGAKLLNPSAFESCFKISLTCKEG